MRNVLCSGPISGTSWQGVGDERLHGQMWRFCVGRGFETTTNHTLGMHIIFGLFYVRPQAF